MRLMEGRPASAAGGVADESLLDDPDGGRQPRPGRHAAGFTASAGAQVRESAALAAEANLALLADEGRPRAVVVAGVGTAGRTGDLLATVAGPRCPVPVVRHRSAGIPGWVGAADVVIAVSRLRSQPGGARRRRGRRPPRCPAGRDRRRPTRELQALAERARAPFIPVPRRAPARASLWALTVPVLLAARTLGLVEGQRGRPRRDRGPARRRRRALPAGRRVLRQPGQVAGARTWPARSRSSGARRRWPPWPPAGSATRCRPTPATRWWPGRWARPAGAGSACSTASSAAWPSRRATSSPTATRAEPDPTRLRLVLLRDGGLNRRRRRPTSRSRSRSAGPTRCRPWPSAAACAATWSPAEGGSALERLASLIAVPDFASVYLALAHGLDPMAVPAVDEMKELCEHRPMTGVRARRQWSERERRHQGDRRGPGREPRHRGDQVRRVPADRLVVDAGRGDPLGRRLGQPGAAAARRQAGHAARRPREHPFGYGRERYIYAFIVSIVLFSVGGLFALYEGVPQGPAPGADRPRGSGCRCVVLVVAIGLEGFSFRTAIKESNHIRGKATWVELHPPGQGAGAAGGAAGGLRRADRSGPRAVRRRADPDHRQRRVGRRSAPRDRRAAGGHRGRAGDRDEEPAARRGGRRRSDVADDRAGDRRRPGGSSGSST